MHRALASQWCARLSVMPKGWTPAGKQVWHELANGIPAGVATRCDRIIVELTARLIISMRESKLPTPALASQIRACLGSLGCTPADRSRVKVEESKVADDDSDFWT
jgi:hypothetical protein